MRIIKLSMLEFETLDDVIDFFENDLLSRNPLGKFRLTPGWISEAALSFGEPLLFSYQTTVQYTAQADSGRLDNHDEYSDDYPYYFLIDMPSVQPTNISLYAIEDRLRKVGHLMIENRMAIQ